MLIKLNFAIIFSINFLMSLFQGNKLASYH